MHATRTFLLFFVYEALIAVTVVIFIHKSNGAVCVSERGRMTA